MAPASKTSNTTLLLKGGLAVLLSIGLVALAGTNTPSLTAAITGDSEATESDSIVLASTQSDLGTDTALFDSSVVHDVQITFDQDDYTQLVDDYVTTGEKTWIEATVTIDGTTFENVGIRLKGNSSLFSVSQETSGSPEDLPWLIRLDKYIDGQTYQGYGDLVIRSNSTETAINEAVAVELLELAGLASEQAIATTFTVNGGETELRLAMEHPDDEWDDANFDNDDGALYKADSEGDYSYRGDDPDAYEDVFNQKAGDDDLEPLIDFLDFINNADDDIFSNELADHLDIEAFATYLALQDLVGNADDINGRGNNSYLHYDYESEQFTVVSWDLNLAFDTANVGGGQPGGVGGADDRPEPPGGAGAFGAGDAGPGDGGPGDQPNVLVDRFMANEAFVEMYDEATAELTEILYASGAAEAIVATWVDVLTASASDIVGAVTIDAEAAAITDYIATIYDA